MSEDAAPPSIVMTDRTSAESHVPWLASRDVPLVIAFAREWTSAGAAEHELAAIRSELRGLGAVLVVVSSAGIWHFRPDDDIERFAAGVPVGSRVRLFDGAVESDPMDPLARELLTSGCAATLSSACAIEVTGTIGDRTLDAFVEPVRPPVRLFVFGAGHDAVSVVDVDTEQDAARIVP